MRLFCVEFVQQIFLQGLQQHFVQSLQAHNRAIVALHELLYRHVIGIVEIAEGVRQVALQIEQQPIFAAPGGLVEQETDLPEETPALFQGLVLRLGQ